MTAEDWKKVEDRLSIPYSSAELKVDGYSLTIGHALEKPLKYCLAVYIDGFSRLNGSLKIAISAADSVIITQNPFLQLSRKKLLSEKERLFVKKS